MAGPLHGITVIELAGLGPAPFAATLLADLGAHVLRIERPGAPPGGLDRLGQHRAVLQLDLASAAGGDEVRRLAGRADVLLEGFRPGVTERLGLGPEELLARNPRLVYGRMTGWGQAGPRAQQAGHDINYLALTGALHAIGEAGRAPVPPLNLVADFGGGSLFLVVGVLAALAARTADGGGQVVDAAMVDGASYLMLMFHRMLGDGAWTDARGSNLLDGGVPWYATYPCADGRYVAVGALEPQFWAQLLDGLGLDPAELPARDELAGWPAVRDALAAAFARRPRDHWVEVFAGSDACVSPVLSLTEAPADLHARSRGSFSDGSAGPEPAPAPRFSRTAAARTPVTASETLAAFGLA